MSNGHCVKSSVIVLVPWYFYSGAVLPQKNIPRSKNFHLRIHTMTIGGLAVVAFWPPHGPLGSGLPRAGYSQKKKKKKKKIEERKGQKGRFNIFAMAGVRTQSAPDNDLKTMVRNFCLINPRQASINGKSNPVNFFFQNFFCLSAKNLKKPGVL